MEALNNDLQDNIVQGYTVVTYTKVTWLKRYIVCDLPTSNDSHHYNLSQPQP